MSSPVPFHRPETGHCRGLQCDLQQAEKRCSEESPFSLAQGLGSGGLARENLLAIPALLQLNGPRCPAPAQQTRSVPPPGVGRLGRERISQPLPSKADDAMIPPPGCRYGAQQRDEPPPRLSSVEVEPGRESGHDMRTPGPPPPPNIGRPSCGPGLHLHPALMSTETEQVRESQHPPPRTLGREGPVGSLRFKYHPHPWQQQD